MKTSVHFTHRLLFKVVTDYELQDTYLVDPGTDEKLGPCYFKETWAREGDGTGEIGKGQTHTTIVLEFDQDEVEKNAQQRIIRLLEGEGEEKCQNVK